MTTSAPQWPGQDGMHEPREVAQPTQMRDASLDRAPGTPRRTPDPVETADPPLTPRPKAVPDPPLTQRPKAVPNPPLTPRLKAVPDPPLELTPGVIPDPPLVLRARGVAEVVDLVERRRQQQRLRRAAARRNRFVVVRDAAEKDLWAARRRARADLPSPVPVTRDIALALLEVEAGCRSALQLERVFSPQLWEALEHRIGRRGGPLPSGRSLISVRCQEDRPGLADTVAVVRRGELVRPVALRLDACGGRWTVTELRWWRNETDTAATPGRDGGTS
jgi:Family of unknown function (DUF6459)